MGNAKHIELVATAKAHFAADMLLKGTYGDFDGEFRGCSVGCHVKHIKPNLSKSEFSALNKHKVVSDYYEYPEWLALLQDTIFEGLPNGESAKWHVQMAEAISSRDGAIDWQETLHRVHIGILRLSYVTAGASQQAVMGVLELHERASRGEAVEDKEWSAARSAAWSAARSAAWSAAWSAAESAARSAAWSAAESAARSAAESAARSAAWSAAESAAESAARSAAESAARSAAESAAESAARSAAESAARSAAWSAAESAAYQEIRDVVLDVLSGKPSA